MYGMPSRSNPCGKTTAPYAEQKLYLNSWARTVDNRISSCRSSIQATRSNKPDTTLIRFTISCIHVHVSKSNIGITSSTQFMFARLNRKMVPYSTNPQGDKDRSTRRISWTLGRPSDLHVITRMTMSWWNCWKLARSDCKLL